VSDEKNEDEKVDRIEAILARLEPRIAEIVGELRQLPKRADHASLKADVARIEGRLANTPKVWQMLTMVVGTWRQAPPLYSRFCG